MSSCFSTYPRTPLFAFLLILSAIGLLARCSSTRAPQSSDADAEASTGPAYVLLYTTEAGELILHDVQTSTSQTLADGVRFTGARALSPDERYLAFSYATSDSSHLALLNLETQALKPVHAHEGEVAYSLAWHPQGDRLAFAFYTPTRDGGRGPGDVLVATSDGSTRRVGCRAAREVLHWLPDGSLATRNDDNLYIVAPSDCRTRASADARRMNHITYGPAGQRLAYIHYELNYDRSAGTYVPDSSLFLSDAHGQSAEQILGADRHVRHLRWAPRAPELAFDMHVPESGHRQIVIYNGTSDRTVYLIPLGNASSADQLHPRWSPSGNHIAFTLRGADGASAAVRVKGQTRRLAPTAGPVWGWLTDQTLIARGSDSLRVVTLQGQTLHAQPAPAQLIHAWARPVI